ncbi:MAG TPA: DUF2868 domain-containing protein, partial [Campylobacterales bacterium]|nr:DUF2868 domain-containing protein [Campylobacterales bacterium]
MKLSLSSYLDTVQLLQHYRGTHEENRTFALKHEEFASSPLAMVLAWSASNRFQISPSGHSPKYQKHWTAMTQFLAFWFLVLGFVTGLGLLSYSGEAPVNVIYYLFIAMVLPIVGMLLSLLSLKSGKNLGDFFAHFFPLYWFEKMMQALSSQYRRTWERTSTLPTSVQRWLFIERLQLFSLLFSVGLLLALLIMVVVKDIAFGWSTTLNVTPEAFHALLSIVGWGWHGWLPSAVPSIELVELSQYFRLGERLETEMVNNANRLGAWWQFLAMTTLVYAIGLRLLFWGVTHWGFQRVLEHAFMRIEGVERLQRHFGTPFVT